MTTNDATGIEITLVEEIELDDEESPPTDPSPVVQTSSPQRVDNPDDDLEKRLAWLAAEVRSTSAQQAQKKRAESVLEAREYKTALVPAAKEPPKDVDLPKVSFAAGVDSQREPTQIMKRPSTHEWEFNTSEPEELSRTLPLDPNAAIADPLPFDAPRASKPIGRSRAVIAAFGIAAGILLGGVAYPQILHSLYQDKYTLMPQVHGSLDEAADKAWERYNEWRQDGEMVQWLVPQPPTSALSTTAPETPSIAEFPDASGRYFPYVRPAVSTPKVVRPPPQRTVSDPPTHKEPPTKGAL